MPFAFIRCGMFFLESCFTRTRTAAKNFKMPSRSSIACMLNKTEITNFEKQCYRDKYLLYFGSMAGFSSYQTVTDRHRPMPGQVPANPKFYLKISLERK